MTKKDETNWGAAIAKAAKVVIGVLIVLAGLFLVWLWWPEFLYVFKGLLGIIVILVGIIVVALGATD